MNTSMNYDEVWRKMSLRKPDLWPLWKILSGYTKNTARRLEIGAGSLPKFPIEDTYFLDQSIGAISQLQNAGGKGTVGDAENLLPFESGFFGAVGAFEVLEHLKHPEGTLKEISRVLEPGGHFLFSVPVHQKYWSRWDAFAGHIQRFEPQGLASMLSDQGLEIVCCYDLRRATNFSLPFAKYLDAFACSVVSHFPQLYYCCDFCFYPYAWIVKVTTRPKYHQHFFEVPKNSLSIFGVCRKTI